MDMNGKKGAVLKVLAMILFSNLTFFLHLPIFLHTTLFKLWLTFRGQKRDKNIKG